MGNGKEKTDSLYWQVERECHRLQMSVATSHSRRGNRAVLMTNRNLTDEQKGDLSEARVEAFSTR